MKKKIALAITAIISASSLFSQNIDSVKVKPHKISPPVPVEAFIGNNGLVFQMIVSKHFSPESRFGFFNVTSFTGDYASQNQKNSYLSQAFITADIWKGLSVNAGATMHFKNGFRPSAGLQYVFANRKILALVLPRFDLTQTYNFELFGLVEYKPKFTKSWGLYSRVQGLFDHNTKQNFHDRSYMWLRLGASYKNFQFGVGSNFDFYGPNKTNENSFGGFLRIELI